MKKKSRILTVLLLACYILTIPASAYYASVTASYEVLRAGIKGYSTIEANTDTGLSELLTQVNIVDENLVLYEFDNETLENPKVSTLTAVVGASRSTLEDNMGYYVQGYGYIKYMTKYGEETKRYNDEKYLYYQKSAKNAEQVETDESSKLRLAYNEERAAYILDSFGKIPDQYEFASDYELLDYVETEDYIAMKETLATEPKITLPSFFIGNDVIFGVCQDTDAVNYLYEFAKNSDGHWDLVDTQRLQVDGCYQDVYESYSEYQAAMATAK